MASVVGRAIKQAGWGRGPNMVWQAPPLESELKRTSRYRHRGCQELRPRTRRQRKRRALKKIMQLCTEYINRRIMETNRCPFDSVRASGLQSTQMMEDNGIQIQLGGRKFIQV